MIDIKFFDYCPREALEVRISVFCDEQGFCDGLDETDKKAAHLVAFEDGIPVGTCRLIRHDEQSFFFGRLAVLSSRRGKSIGTLIMKRAEEFVLSQKARRIFLHAQMRAKGFYEKCGYTPFGEVEYEENYPHIWMEKNLSPVTHHLNLNPSPFECIAGGIKTYELRLDDEKRKYIYVGDKIIFTNTKNASTLTCRVIALHRFPSFEELYNTLPLDRCGYTEADISTAHYTDMEEYYPRERQQMYGVLGIEIELIKE